MLTVGDPVRPVQRGHSADRMGTVRAASALGSAVSIPPAEMDSRTMKRATLTAAAHAAHLARKGADVR